MGFYAFLYGAFNRWFCKWRPLRAIGLIRVPDLNGPWKFRIRSTYRKTEIDAVVAIHQTWRMLQVPLETRLSRSLSEIASLVTDDPCEFVLNYEFLNTPKQGAAVGTMHVHRGSVEIRFPKDGKIAAGVGEYYSGRDRENQGQLEVERSTTRERTRPREENA
jgi:hypothetical protein